MSRAVKWQTFGADLALCPLHDETWHDAGEPCPHCESEHEQAEKVRVGMEKLHAEYQTRYIAFCLASKNDLYGKVKAADFRAWISEHVQAYEKNVQPVQVNQDAFTAYLWQVACFHS